MFATNKQTRQPNSTEQQLDTFNWSVRRSDHFLSTLKRKVYILDGYGNLITVANTALPDPKNQLDARLSITTSFVHDRRSRTEQVEDRAFAPTPKDLIDLYDIRGDAGVVLTQTVEFPLEELLRHEIIKDVNSNYCISLDREALAKHAARKVAREPDTAPIKQVDNMSLALNLSVVDNRPNAPKVYYVNLAGRVFCVPVVTGSFVEDGVWIDSNLKQEGMPMMEFQPLDISVYQETREVIPAVTLFTSALEAKRFGDADAQLKEEARRKEREILDLKHTLELTKAESAKAKAELESKSDIRKDSYEASSYRRKDDSEKIGVVAKTIAGIVALAGAIVTFVRWFG